MVAESISYVRTQSPLFTDRHLRLPRTVVPAGRL